MTEALATYDNGKAAILETVLIKGDLAKLTEAERVSYYYKMCEVVGVNPHTRPFEYIVLDGKLTLYARKDCTDQIRKRDSLNTRIAATENDGETYTVRAVVSDQNGRTEESTGTVSLVKEDGEWKTAASGKRYFESNGSCKPLHGEARANAMMKAETKAKRRGTLSFAGLGMLDETEVEDIPQAQPAVTVEKPKPQGLPQGATATPERRQAEARYLEAYTKARKAGMNPQPLTAYATSPLSSLDQGTSDILDSLAAKA